ncbi:hypothetical protein AAA799P11_00411 [Marine Group I thaumarchaeote SCGC AAA799-P11]|uniref:Uncharacterized protein n=1 Tax=Marine Group I thaumarchaeote SCGC AAA799-P11 TaxID=1502295 RepID=A0A087S2C3_9ARCH|nr:hypothetical protein AAA799P11_00411 [Marine Group I thaumarchaeote SCGC AAA799-P11]
MDVKTGSEVALAHLKNKQFITAHTLFSDQAESVKKIRTYQICIIVFVSC